MFKYLLRLPDGQPPDPAMLVTAVPTWAVGDVITVSAGEQLRVVAIDDFPHAELVEHDLGRSSPSSPRSQSWRDHTGTCASVDVGRRHSYRRAVQRRVKEGWSQ